MHVVSPPTCTMSLIHIIHKQAKRVKAKHTLFVIEAFCFKKKQLHTNTDGLNYK